MKVIRNMKSRYRGTRKAFTIIEAMIATIIIGIAFTALIASSRAYTQTNGAGIEISTAEFLIENIREMTAPLAVIEPETGDTTFGAESGETAVSLYDDIDDFDGGSFSPPVDINGISLSALSAYTQQVTVQNINANDFSAVVSDHASDFVRITVTILINDRQISSASWIRAKL